MFERGVSFVPGSAPAGRAWVNWPVAKTRLPTITWSQTTPLICTVGNAAADTVSGTDGSGGTVSAAAGVMPMFSAMKAKFALDQHDCERRRRPLADRGEPLDATSRTDTHRGRGRIPSA